MSRTYLALPAVFLVVLLTVAPIITLAIYSLWQVKFYEIVVDWTLGNYVEAFDRYLGVFLHTFGIGLQVGFATTLMALPFAFALCYKLTRFRETVMSLLLLALFSGYLVRVYAWRIILGENGLMNNFLLWLDVIDAPLQIWFYNRFGLIVTMVAFLLPLAVLPIYASLQNLPLERIHASHDLGAGRIETTLRVVIPEAAIGIGIAFSLCTVLAAGDFVTPTLVGGPSGLMIGQAILSQFGTVYNWPLGGALAVITALCMIGISGVVLGAAWYLRYGRRGRLA